jgi:ADP-glucose pyrophosphorylase
MIGRSRREKAMDSVLALTLAGGRGGRLHPLTIHRAKPAVPCGGKFRIIDFTLSNCINSHIRRIVVLTQYKSLSLDRERFFVSEGGVVVIPKGAAIR